MKNYAIPPNTVHEYSLTPNLRRKLKGGASSSVVYSETVNEKTSYNQVICVAISTSDILLDGSVITVDGVNLLNGAFVLVNGQIDTTENGVYYAYSGGWERYEGIENTPLVIVTKGVINQDTGWLLSTDDIIYDETGIKFRQVFPYDGVKPDSNNVDIAKNSFQIESLRSNMYRFNSARYDGLTVSVDNFVGANYGEALTFTNEVLHGDRMATAASAGTQFFCGRSGLYSIHSHIYIEMAFVADPVLEMSLDLGVFKNGVGYSTLAKDVVKSYETITEPINLYKYSLSGSDLIALEENDIVDLRLYQSFAYPIAAPEYTSYGYFSIKLEDCDYSSGNSAINIR